jgi:biotin carboxyl carrier protein
MTTSYLVRRGDHTDRVSVLEDRGDSALLQIGDRQVVVQLRRLPDGRWLIRDDRDQRLLRSFEERGELVLVDHSAQHRFGVEDERAQWLRGAAGAHGHGGGSIKASMPGRVVRVPVKVGDIVPPQGVVAVLEAMKMENDVRSAGGGVVKAVLVREGQAVEAGQLLVSLEAVS